MESWRTILVIATIAGFLVTVGGLVAAYLGARREYRDSKARVDKMQELAEAELADNPPPPSPGDAEVLIFMGADDKWDAIYAEHDLTRPTYDNTVFLAAYESRRLLGLVLNSTRRDFLVAAFGLLISTAASVGSIYLVS